MSFKSLPFRRPSAAMGVALTALFVSLGGVGYAASTLPAGSVGTAQIQHSAVTHSKLRFNSVSYQDIQQRAVGVRRANLNQLQQRVLGTCGAGTAVGTVAMNGTVTCNNDRPAEFGTVTPTPRTVPGTVATLTLPAGSNYVAFANPVVVNTTGANAEETCSLTNGSSSDSRTVTVIDSGGSAAIPLQLASSAGTDTLSCTGAGTSATASINAIRTSTNS